MPTLEELATQIAETLFRNSVETRALGQETTTKRPTIPRGVKAEAVEPLVLSVLELAFEMGIVNPQIAPKP